MAVFVISFGALLLGLLLIFTLREKEKTEVRCERCGQRTESRGMNWPSPYSGEVEATLCGTCSRELHRRIDRCVEAEIKGFLHFSAEE